MVQFLGCRQSIPPPGERKFLDFPGGTFISVEAVLMRQYAA
jgi:hypothetical protein